MIDTMPSVTEQRSRRRWSVSRILLRLVLPLVVVASLVAAGFFWVASLSDEPDLRSGNVPPVEGATYVEPGSVGYRGSMTDLTPLNIDAEIPDQIDGCQWTDYGLRCDEDDLTLDRVHLEGGLYWTGNGTLTITDSVIEGGADWYVIHAAGETPDVIEVSDSTLRWPSSIPYPEGYDVGVVNDGSANGARMLLYRNDISGLPQGLNPSGDGSVIDQNYIHDLLMSGSIELGTDMHVDGIYPQGGDNITISRNYIEINEELNIWATASIFFQSNGPTRGHRVFGNFLSGGAFAYYNQSALDVEVIGNTFSGTATYGDAVVEDGGTTLIWEDNVRVDGTEVPPPAQ